MVLLALAGCATARPEPAPVDRIGRIYSYVRTDRDGAEAETIHVYRASRTRSSVAKMRGRCLNAAYVTAELDIERRLCDPARRRPAAGPMRRARNSPC